MIIQLSCHLHTMTKVKRCKEKYDDDDEAAQYDCIIGATKEFIARANTCSGMPTPDVRDLVKSVVCTSVDRCLVQGFFANQGPSKSAFCKGSQVRFTRLF